MDPMKSERNRSRTFLLINTLTHIHYKLGHFITPHISSSINHIMSHYSIFMNTI